MNRVAGIFFLSIFLCSATEADELLKLPVLFSHYTQHHKDDNSITFFSFMYDHYVKSPKADDYGHDKLPFKNHDFNSGSCSVYFFTHTFATLKHTSENFQPMDFFIHAQDFVASPHLSAIWQPPKQA